MPAPHLVIRTNSLVLRLMKWISYKLGLLYLSIILTPLSLFAQDLTGIWRGYFISDGGEQYKLEFQVSQAKSNVVMGVSYSYLDVRFYGKATMTGTFLKSSSSFRIREIKTVEVKSILGGATCIMNYNFSYVKSGKEEFLEGTYLGKYETKYKTDPPPSWGDCGGGKVFLRKVTTSDFYVEPFLRDKANTPKPVPSKKPLVKKDTIAAKKTSPVVKKTVTPSKPPVKTNPVVKKPVTTTKPVVKNTTPVKKPVVKPNTNPTTTVTQTILPKQKDDSLQKIVKGITKNDPPVQMTPTPGVLKNRVNELVKTLVVNDPEVTVKIYDNGEIDDDTISVYLDKKIVLAAKRLTAAPLIVKLKMNQDDEEHELVMVAENLGRIPPNTSLMIVESGDQRFDVRITSTEQKNAVVRFKYQKPN